MALCVLRKNPETECFKCPACTPIDADFEGPLIRLRLSYPFRPVRNRSLQQYPAQLADGYFSASHRKAAGKTDVPSRLDKAFFKAPDPDLDARAQQLVSCATRLVAASDVACREKRNDIQGIFATLCRHGCVDDVYCALAASTPLQSSSPIAYYESDIIKGEKFVYINTSIRDLAQAHPKAGITLFYDIACRVHPHLKLNRPELSLYQAALPVLHSYCHSMACQVAFSPRNLYGFGNIDGEGSERLWSRIAPFVGHTTVMTNDHRRDSLTHKFEWENRRLVNSLLDKFSATWEALKDTLAAKGDHEPRTYWEARRTVGRQLVREPISPELFPLVQLAAHIRATERHLMGRGKQLSSILISSKDGSQ